MTGRRTPSPAEALVLVTLSLAVLGAAVAVAFERRPEGDRGFVERFDQPDGLLANERQGHDRVERWRVTSGSLFVEDGSAWTGPPDRATPDEASSHATNSAVFRLVSNDATFGNVSVRARFQVSSLLEGRARDYDGAHLLLRYQSPDRLYAVTLHRRDGLVTVKRKVPGADGDGSYETLAHVHRPTVLGRWFDVAAEVENVDAGVRLRVAIDDQPVLSTVDRSADAILEPGSIGVRLDNVDARFDDIVARPLARAA